MFDNANAKKKFDNVDLTITNNLPFNKNHLQHILLNLLNKKIDRQIIIYIHVLLIEFVAVTLSGIFPEQASPPNFVGLRPRRYNMVADYIGIT